MYSKVVSSLSAQFRRSKNSVRLHLQEKRWGKDPDAIIIHQMGKVGSSTIYETLRRNLPERRVYHTHFLNRSRLTAFVASDPIGEEHYHVACSRFLLEHLDHYERVRIITLVREPIARNVSAFFENRFKFFKDKDLQQWERNLSDLKERFLRNYPHDIPLIWLDEEIRDAFGLDVYSQPFPIEEGGAVFNSQRIQLLIMRQDELNRVGAKFLSSFLGHEIPALESANIGERKGYSKLYKSFLSKLHFPEQYVEKMYDSKYAQHFFSTGEIAELRQRWTD
jgi:hypothetical protein